MKGIHSLITYKIILCLAYRNLNHHQNLLFTIFISALVNNIYLHFLNQRIFLGTKHILRTTKNFKNTVQF